MDNIAGATRFPGEHPPDRYFLWKRAVDRGPRERARVPISIGIEDSVTTFSEHHEFDAFSTMIAPRPGAPRGPAVTT